MSDVLDFIPEVTIKNVIKLSHTKMLEGLRPYVLEKIPEGLIGNEEGIREADRLIGRFANLYSYLIYLQSHVHSEASRHKLMGDDGEYEVLTRKKTSLYELARGVRYKQEACSRMLTARLSEESDDDVFDKPDYKGRVQREQNRRLTGWDAVKS